MLKQELEEFFEDHKCIMIISIGNDMRGDDGFGPFIAENLSTFTSDFSDILVVNAGTVPENYTGLIRKVQPSHIIFVDAVEMNSYPGDIKLIQKDKIADYSISTHAMPLSFMIRYIETFTNPKIVLIGVQPKNMELSGIISAEVRKSALELIEVLRQIFFHIN